MARRTQKHVTFSGCKCIFRTVLKGWKVRYSKKPSDPPWPHVDIDHQKRTAVIFPFDYHKGSKKRSPPSDYYLHEMMHVCLRAVRDAKDQYWREEQFVRIVCDLIEKTKSKGYFRKHWKLLGGI